MDSNPTLVEAIFSYIANTPQKRITFAEYMDMALYHPEYGYYSTKAVNIGKSGDFFTSVHLGSDFGELLGEQFYQMWSILAEPTSFHIIEMGAGQGYLALDILKYLQQKYSDFFVKLEYIIIEKSPALKEEQQQKLLDFPVRWCELSSIPTNSVIGCFFSNELVDALPVHQFIKQAGELQEIYVANLGNGERLMGNGEISASSPPLPLPPSPFTEVIDKPSSDKLTEYLQLVGINTSEYADEYRSEINLSSLDWLSSVAERLQRGYVLTIDYGYPATRYYNPRRNRGTLQCYYQHQRHDNPYIYVGEQDITTHVNFTALERWGERCGLVNLGFTQQGLFLMALGLGDRIASLSEQKLPINELLKRRDTLHQLIDPIGFGDFGVLAQSKGLTEAESLQKLKGFHFPV